MDQRIRNTVAVVTIAVIGLLSLAACKENTIINSNLVPTVDNIHTFEVSDTVTYFTKTIIDDSVVTSYNVAPSLGSVGTANGDAFFGNTSNGIYFQIVPPTTSYSFPVARNLIDSAVIVLPYNFSWGDTSAAQIPQHMKAYRLTDSMKYDSLYYSFNRFGVDRFNPIGEVNNVTISKMRSADSTAPYLSIRLNSDFIDSFYNNASQYASYPDFIRWFKGIYVEADTAGPGNTLHYFRLDGSGYHTTAGILFYSKGVVTADSVIAAFSYNTSACTHSTWVKRTYGAPLQSLINSTQQSDNYVAIQNEPGAAALIRIPYLTSLAAAMGKSIVNKAELILTKIDTLNASTWTEPARIYPVGTKDSNGTTSSYSIADRYPLTSTEPLGFIDGNADQLVVGTTLITVYHINFPRELQQAIVQGRSALNLRINGTQSYVGAYRLLAGGKNHPTAKTQLHIVYSKIN